jgi:hypothetical protein
MNKYNINPQTPHKGYDAFSGETVDRGFSATPPGGIVEVKRVNKNSIELDLMMGNKRLADELKRFSERTVSLDLHAPGAKADDGKIDLDLVLGSFTRALKSVGEIGTAGAKKYSRNGWLQVPNAISRYSSAMWRHIFQFKEGEFYDKESGQLHLAHAAWNALAVLELFIRQQEESKAGSNTRSVTK